MKRYVPTRLLLGTAIGAAGVWVADAAASFEHLIPALLAGLVLAIVGAVFVRWLAAKLAELHDDWAVKGEKKLDTIDQGQGWAFAFWGGDFYMFHAPNGNSIVTRYRPSDDSLTQVATLPSIIVGAGVSTCAPQQ